MSHKCTETDIYWWTRHDEYGWLSNFSRYPIVINNKEYPTVEHWYQSQKQTEEEYQESIRILIEPKEAKFAGYHAVLRSDWESIKNDIMLNGLSAKFTQHEELKQMLINTTGKNLHEDSPWDKYWGHANGNGKDILGLLLMQVRTELISGSLF